MISDRLQLALGTLLSHSETVSTLWPEDNSLANKLKIVARLITGGLVTPIYIVNLGGFDTHANQVEEGANETGKHANLMKYISEAVYAFQDEISQHGKQNDVIGLVYSEFGRRVASNSSAGTDHGEAYPMMLFGSQINPIVYGNNPVIPEEVEKKTNVQMETDFRSVYASILYHWFKVDSSEISNILFKDFEILPILKSNVNVADEYYKTNGLNIMAFYPNPVTDNAKIQFTTNGGHITLKLFSLTGQELRTLIDSNLPTGNQFVSFNRNGVVRGQYYLVLQNGSERVSQLIAVQ